MKNNLKMILLCLGAGLASLPALRADDAPPATPPPAAPEGHGGRGHGNRGEKMLEHLAKALNLTPDEQTKWDALNQQERDAVKSLWSDGSVTKDQRRPKMEEIRKNFEGQRRALLTSDQQAKFDEIIAKMRERMHERREGQGQAAGQDAPPPPPPPADNK
jgi:Spy/CpxP family protein refolding chaperone